MSSEGGETEVGSCKRKIEIETEESKEGWKSVSK